MIDELELRSRYPEIPWDQPVLVSVTGLHRWVCRYCIAMHGLKAQDIVQKREPEFVYHDRADALAHIDNEHHDSTFVDE